jgi:hypothetical protein
MQAIVIAIVTSLGLVVIPFAVRLLKGAGIGVVTYTGLTYATDFFSDLIQQNLQGLPADALAILGLTQVDVAVNMIISAVLARAILNGFNEAGTRKQFKMQA